MKTQNLVFHVVVLALILAGGRQSFAQDGKLAIHASPKQAYVFVDGRAVGEASRHRVINLTPGEHKVALYNYGYSSASNNVSITAGQTSDLEVNLQPVSGTVSGPWGAMTLEGANRDAVLLNGKSPDYFVGHGDEFNHDWWWKQELVVPPGKYQVTVLREGNEVWSGPVDVPVNQRVVIDIPKGVRKTVAWSRGEKLSAIPRFRIGTASATVAVAKPSGQLSATTAQVNCGEGSQLKWTSADAPQVEISGVGPVAASGEQSIQPKQTTTYELTASGPGGTATSAATINVNNAIRADIGLSPTEVHYRRVGDQVVQDDSTALNWSAANADKVTIDPLGAVSPSGNRDMKVTPHRTDAGPVDETVTYTLTATNACGATETRTAALHIVGAIEQPEAALALNSVYFPTDLPAPGDLQAGLLHSQQGMLISIAKLFNEYLVHHPGAHLILAGHADERGPDAYNQPLSERRAKIVQDVLMEQGVPAGDIETHAYGESKNLSADEVRQLLDKNPELSADAREKVLQRIQTIVLANNRRVDIALSTGQESVRQYPFNADDYAALVDRNGPNKEEAKEGVQPAAQKEKVKN